MGPPAPRAPGRARPRWGDRLVRGGGGFEPRSRPFGGLHTGPSPVDRARAGSKHHVLTDARDLPLAVAVTGGHRNDVTQLILLVDAVASMEARDGRRRVRPERIVADRGYDHDKHRMLAREREIEPVVARRRTEHGSGLGKERWVVERTISWLHQFRRLRIRWERDPEIHLAFMHLACAIVCWRRLRSL